MTDGENYRYSIPSEALNKPVSSKNLRTDMLGFNINKQDSAPFSFKLTDPADDNNWLLNTEGQNFIFSDKYIQMDFLLPSQRQYGFGERSHTFKLGEGAWGMWNTGRTPKGVGLDEGRGRGGQYGTHPFVLVQSKRPQKYFGIFFRNSNP